MTSRTDSRAPLQFSGHKNLTWRLVIATLTGRPIRISQIRTSSSTHPGLLPHEVSFIRLLDAITNGSFFEFSQTGTTLFYRPGLIIGSEPGRGASSAGIIDHEVPANCTRGISYFMVPLCILAPFSKTKVNIRFHGAGVITSATLAGDISVDTVRTAVLPVFAQFGISMRLEIRVDRRSCAGPGGKGGSGEVHILLGHQILLPKTLHLLRPGKVKSVRGVAYSTGVAGTNNYRMIDAARKILNPLVSDVYIFSDTSPAPLLINREKTASNGKTGIGFGLCLVAETSSGCLFSADIVSNPDGGDTAEVIGERCVLQLLEVISKGGCLSPISAAAVLIMMSMGSEDVGRIQVSKLIIGTKELVTLARDLTDFGCSAWGFRDSPDNPDEVVLSIVGRGVGNIARKVA